jgi:KDO2-lipid IV(A) lauroyltransferase
MLADMAYLSRGRSIRAILRNASYIFSHENLSERRRLYSRAATRAYLRYWRELLYLPKVDRAYLEGKMKIEGTDALSANRALGRGCILALPHMGNWEYAGIWLAGIADRLTVVADEFQPEFLCDWLFDLRMKKGIEVIRLKRNVGQGIDVLELLADRLCAGGVVCLLPDSIRDPTDDGPGIFGQSIKISRGPAVLALKTGAALLPATLWNIGDGWCGRIHEEIQPITADTSREKITAMTQKLVEIFEEAARGHLEDLHELWYSSLADMGPNQEVPRSRR